MQAYAAATFSLLMLWKLQIFSKNLRMHIRISHDPEESRTAVFVEKDNC